MIQKTLIDVGESDSGKFCVCCRKRYAIDDVRCLTCITRGNGGIDSTNAGRLRKHRPDDWMDWLKAIESRNSGLKRRSRERQQPKAATATQLVFKLIDQQFSCYFTGYPLDADDSLRLAHISPATDGGSFEIDNLVWTTHQINKMMGTLDGDQFILLCQRITKIQIDRMVDAM